MYCKKCGAKNKDDARFCAKCGCDMTQKTIAQDQKKQKKTEKILEFRELLLQRFYMIRRTRYSVFYGSFSG